MELKKRNKALQPALPNPHKDFFFARHRKNDKPSQNPSS